MNKTYIIAKGNNLGQNQFMVKDDELSNFTYQNSLQNIYNDTEIIWEGLRQTNYYEILQQSKEFQEWEKTEEADSFTKMQYLQKILSFMPPEILDKVKQYQDFKKQKYQQTLTLIEEMYKNSTNPKDVLPIEFGGEFALLEDRKVLLHNIPMPSSIEEVEGRKDLGFLASEWFGKLEHRQEDRFCASFIKSKGLKPKENNIKENSNPHLTFIFDAESKDFKSLKKLDLFQYCRNKQKDNLDKYSADEIKLLESLLEWSPGAKRISEKQPTWSAIPGGVPSGFVVGVIANDIKENSKEMEIAIKVAEKFGVPLLRSDLTAVVGNSLRV